MLQFHVLLSSHCLSLILVSSPYGKTMICIIFMFYMLVNPGMTSSDLQHDVTNYIHLKIIIVSIITCKFIETLNHLLQMSI